MITPDQTSASAKASTGSRLRGVAVIILGLAVGYFSVVRPLQQAYSNAPEISLHFKFASLSTPLVLLGLLMTIWPNALTVFMAKGGNKLTFAGWILVVALLIIGFGTWYLVDEQISSLGYKH